MFEIIPLDNELRWNNIICSMQEYDFYHLAAYHKLDASGEASLFVFETQENVFAFPFVKRNIKNTSFYDITSVYGYGGPLFKNNSILAEDVNAFHAALRKYFSENKIVSVFSSLHPLFRNQEKLVDGLGKVENLNNTVAINLQLSPEEQWRQYTYSVKYQINLLKREGIYIRMTSTKKAVDDFIKIYEDNMRRVNATPKYFFSTDYFYKFLKDINSVVFLAYLNNEVVAGSLCTFCNKIMQTHLSATNSKFLALSPLKYVIDAARIEGVKRNMKWLHLGGGRSGKNDSLFEFKSYFSNERFTFKVWKYICNEEIYNSLVQEKYKNPLLINSFFPLYRL